MIQWSDRMWWSKKNSYQYWSNSKIHHEIDANRPENGQNKVKNIDHNTIQRKEKKNHTSKKLANSSPTPNE